MRYVITLDTNKEAWEIEAELNKVLPGAFGLQYIPSGYIMAIRPTPSPEKLAFLVKEVMKDHLKPIQAIKALRVLAWSEGYHLGLKEAKAAIESAD